MMMRKMSGTRERMTRRGKEAMTAVHQRKMIWQILLMRKNSMKKATMSKLSRRGV